MKKMLNGCLVVALLFIGRCGQKTSQNKQIQPAQPVSTVQNQPQKLPAIRPVPKDFSYLCVLLKGQERGGFLYFNFVENGKIPLVQKTLLKEKVTLSASVSRADTASLKVSMGIKGHLETEFVPGTTQRVALVSGDKNNKISLICELLEMHIDSK